ncbi:mismatch-specific DNA-glycosylase [Bradyrhizobium sp. PUT101]|uniref:mismatch-specific DNA-glycosylase n=1 Tax=Bradyrhizobium sp. PUT101 TaxID=3447427 RepID=UPI003F867CBD
MPELSPHRLPDLFRPNLRLVFVGTAASTRSAELGHYYAHPGNRFWRAIHEAGITPRRYQPGEFAELIELGIGFTDFCETGASTKSSSAPILRHEHHSPHAGDRRRYRCAFARDGRRARAGCRRRARGSRGAARFRGRYRRPRHRRGSPATG